MKRGEKLAMRQGAAEKGRNVMRRGPSKQEILQRKRHVEAGRREGATPEDCRLAQESALWLLDRSLSLGHTTLSASRLALALEVGAPLSQSHKAWWRAFCDAQPGHWDKR